MKKKSYLEILLEDIRSINTYLNCNHRLPMVYVGGIARIFCHSGLRAGQSITFQCRDRPYMMLSLHLKMA